MYEPPRVGFASSQQKLLMTALRGGTDEDLAQELEISLSGIKKAWQTIYAKAEKSGIQIPDSHESAARGKERKRNLLDYMRAHPEELRPVDMKFLIPRKGRS